MIIRSSGIVFSSSIGLMSWKNLLENKNRFLVNNLNFVKNNTIIIYGWVNVCIVGLILFVYCNIKRFTIFDKLNNMNDCDQLKQ